MYKNYFKRIFDLIFASIGFIILLPIFLLVSMLLFVSNNGKPFFFQLRPGLNGKIFKIIKFKTMNDQKDPLGNYLSDEIRLTKLGAFVRKTSLDEIPQLINVIVGDMSLIGPRPLLPEYLQHYTDEQQKRHNVRPGITGLAQVNGRNAISWDEKFEFDVFYVKKMTVLLDLKVVFMTIFKIFKTNEVSAFGHSTMPRFDEHKKAELKI